MDLGSGESLDDHHRPPTFGQSQSGLVDWTEEASGWVCGGRAPSAAKQSGRSAACRRLARKPKLRMRTNCLPVLVEQWSKPGSNDLGMSEERQIAGEGESVTLESVLETGDERAAKHGAATLGTAGWSSVTCTP